MADKVATTVTEFFKAVRKSSEDPNTDYGLRISEDYIKLILRWISIYRPDLLVKALAIVYRSDEEVADDRLD